MKERIVIPKDKIKVLTSGSRFPANGYFTFYKEDVEVEQVPENWEELKEMCFNLPNKIEYYTYNEEELIGISGMYFWQKGRITHNIYDDGVYVYAKNRTPQQMWGIIKNLIGEE